MGCGLGPSSLCDRIIESLLAGIEDAVVDVALPMPHHAVVRHLGNGQIRRVPRPRVALQHAVERERRLIAGLRRHALQIRTLGRHLFAAGRARRLRIPVEGVRQVMASLQCTRKRAVFLVKRLREGRAPTGRLLDRTELSIDVVWVTGAEQQQPDNGTERSREFHFSTPCGVHLHIICCTVAGRERCRHATTERRLPATAEPMQGANRSDTPTA